MPSIEEQYIPLPYRARFSEKRSGRKRPFEKYIKCATRLDAMMFVEMNGRGSVHSMHNKVLTYVAGAWYQSYMHTGPIPDIGIFHNKDDGKVLFSAPSIDGAWEDKLFAENYVRG